MEKPKDYNRDNETYDHLVEALCREHPPMEFPPEYAMFARDNLMQWLIRLARYKFLARQLKSTDSVLEIGCGSGLGAVFLAQHCRQVVAMDVKEYEIEIARKINRRDNVYLTTGDFFEFDIQNQFDVVVLMDVIEHMDETTGCKMVAKAAQHLKPAGFLFVGTPSCYSWPYQSDLSKARHVKCYDLPELITLIESSFGRTLTFSMNDEVVHTGYHKLAWYYFVLAFCPKSSEH